MSTGARRLAVAAMQLPERAPEESGDLDIAGLLTLRASGDVEAYPLTFSQSLEALGLNCRKVGEGTPRQNQAERVLEALPQRKNFFRLS